MKKFTPLQMTISTMQIYTTELGKIIHLHPNHCNQSFVEEDSTTSQPTTIMMSRKMVNHPIIPITTPTSSCTTTRRAIISPTNYVIYYCKPQTYPPLHFHRQPHSSTQFISPQTNKNIPSRHDITKWKLAVPPKCIYHRALCQCRRHLIFSAIRKYWRNICYGMSRIRTVVVVVPILLTLVLLIISTILPTLPTCNHSNNSNNTPPLHLMKNEASK